MPPIKFFFQILHTHLPPLAQIAPNYKKFSIPLTHLSPFAPNYPHWKKMPQIKKTFENSTYTFAPNCPQIPPFASKLEKNAPMWKTMPGRIKQVPQDSTE